jgi:hypothetical protein
LKNTPRNITGGKNMAIGVGETGSKLQFIRSALLLFKSFDDLFSMKDVVSMMEAEGTLEALGISKATASKYAGEIKRVLMAEGKLHNTVNKAVMISGGFWHLCNEEILSYAEKVMYKISIDNGRSAIDIYHTIRLDTNGDVTVSKLNKEALTRILHSFVNDDSGEPPAFVDGDSFEAGHYMNGQSNGKSRDVILIIKGGQIIVPELKEEVKYKLSIV